MGLALPALLATRAATASRNDERKAVILINLTGGMSHIDSLDMKPDAPAEIRGEFKPISTAVAGIQICEHLPRLAARMRHWALVRSLSHGENGHLPGTHRLLTGSDDAQPAADGPGQRAVARDWPCYAAGLDYLRPRHDGVPNGVTLPHALIEGPLTWPGQHAGFLGPAHDPMLVTQDPNSPTFRMDTFTLAKGTDPDGSASGASCSTGWTRTATPRSAVTRSARFEILTAPRDGRGVSASIRNRRGSRSLRPELVRSVAPAGTRLVQAGVPIVQANMGIVQSWDTHVDNWGRLKNRLLRGSTRGSRLIDDLDAEGWLDRTFVAAVGEFGRTPKVSTLPGQTIPGRDHWARVYSGLFAGAGVVGGRVIGKSDRGGAYPVSTAYTPFDIGATIYRVLGVDADEEIRDALNRPTRLIAGTPIEVLFRNT